MNVKIEEVENNKVKLEIEVDADVLEEGLNKSYRKNAKRFNVPGFRKGRAPRSIVERVYGVEVLYEDAIDIICPEYYEKAIALDPKKPEYHQNYSVLLLNDLRDYEKAKRELEILLKLDPENEKARKNYDLLMKKKFDSNGNVKKKSFLRR